MSSAGPSAGEDTAKDTANMDNVVLLHLNQTKRIDMKVIIYITGIANCVVRDGNGNLLPFVWTRQSVCNEFENATLLTREALQKHLQNFIDTGVKENLEILQKVNDPALLVDWVVRTAEYWEKRYAEKRFWAEVVDRRIWERHFGDKLSFPATTTRNMVFGA